MKISIFQSLLSSLRQLVDRIFWRHEKVETLFPKCPEDVVQILCQARDNSAQVKAVGGSFPTAPVKGDILVNTQYMDRLLGLDVNQQTVIAEPGMRLSTLSSLLETVNLTLDLSGTLPDLSIVDALAVGLLGTGKCMSSSLLSVEVVTARAELTSWSWSSHPAQMAALCSGLGLVAVVIAVTFKCLPLFRVSEISYLSSIREILDTWSLVHHTSQSQQLVWFPFSELVVLTHTSQLDRNSWAVKQSWVNQRLTDLSLWMARVTRRINVILFPGLPLFSSMFARVQFISMWTAAKHRSDHAHLPQNFCDCDTLRGSLWLVPLASLPPLLYSISIWSSAHPAVVTSPLGIQTMRPPGDLAASTSHSHPGPYLQPSLEDASTPTATVWYDWFLPETTPDPTVVAQFEDLFYSAGGVKLWSGERIVSPLSLSTSFPQYRSWCQVKKEVDPDNLLASGYVQGTVWSPATHPPPPPSRRRTVKGKKTVAASSSVSGGFSGRSDDELSEAGSYSTNMS